MSRRDRHTTESVRRWPGHTDVAGSFRKHLKTRLDDVEAKTAVVSDVCRVRGVQVACQARLVGQRKHRSQEQAPNAAALDAWMHAERLEIPRTISRMRLLERGADAGECQKCAAGYQRHAEQRRRH